MRRSPGQKLRDRNILEKSHSIWKKINLFQKLKRKLMMKLKFMQELKY
jgi:hypothetical protein